MKSFSNRLARDESGFTLPELLVTMLMMLTVMFALYSIFDMGLRVFSFGNDKVEAVENARIGLERMEREIRAAYPVDPNNDKNYLFFTANDGSSLPSQTMPADDQITFGNDLDGDGEITCPDSDDCEQISYEVYTTGEGTQALGRAEGDGNNEPVVEYVEDVDGDGQALTFEYLTADGDEATSEPEIDVVRIKLDIAVEDGTQTLTTDVHLRNRSNS